MKKKRICAICGDDMYRREAYEIYGHTTEAGNFREDKVICPACSLDWTFDKDGNNKKRRKDKNMAKDYSITQNPFQTGTPYEFDDPINRFEVELSVYDADDNQIGFYKVPQHWNHDRIKEFCEQFLPGRVHRIKTNYNWSRESTFRDYNEYNPY